MQTGGASDGALRRAQPFVEVQIEAGVGLVRFSNPGRRNTLSSPLLQELLAAFTQLEAAAVRAVLLAAQPDGGVWSSGHDIREIVDGGMLDPLSPISPLEQAFHAIGEFPAPVIAVVDGSVWGGAFELVLCCDMLMADARAQFSITPVNIGLPYNATGLARFLHRLPANIVNELFFSAGTLDAAAALQFGLINHLLPADALWPQARALAARIASKAPLAVAVVKQQLRMLAESSFVSAAAVERIEQRRKRILAGADFREGVTAFLQKRPAQFTGQS